MTSEKKKLNIATKYNYFKISNINKLYLKKIFKITNIIFQYYWLNPFYIILKRELSWNLAKLFKNIYHFNIFYFIYHLSYTSAIIVYIIQKQLMCKYPIRTILKDIKKAVWTPMINGEIAGIKILVDGRFRRRGRSKCIWIQKGPLKNSTKNKYIDFSMGNYTSYYSLIGIKVWLLKTHLYKKKAYYWI